MSIKTATRQLQGFPSAMAVIDCEATGGDRSSDRVTEIAVIIIEKGEVTSRWQTLVNPERSIPSFVARLTGITDEMVAGAPKFDDVALTLLTLLTDKTLVAHNAKFDSKLLGRAFTRSGLTLHSKVLCSHTLAKHFFPDKEALGIKALISELNLDVPDRHRAMADANVILELFQHLTDTYPQAKIQKACQQLTYQI